MIEYILPFAAGAMLFAVLIGAAAAARKRAPRARVPLLVSAVVAIVGTVLYGAYQIVTQLVPFALDPILFFLDHWAELQDGQKRLFFLAIAAVVLGVTIVTWLIVRYLWPLFFPTLVRVNRASRGKRSRYGRVYLQQGQRLWFKYGGEGQPFWRFHRLDVPADVPLDREMLSLVIHAARLDRLDTWAWTAVADGSPEALVPTTAANVEDFRSMELFDILHRKPVLASRGAYGSLDVMQTKFLDNMRDVSALKTVPWMRATTRAAIDATTLAGNGEIPGPGNGKTGASTAAVPVRIVHAAPRHNGHKPPATPPASATPAGELGEEAKE